MIVAGLELEAGYLPPLVTQSRNTRIQSSGRGYLDASVGCEILQRPTQQVTRAMGDVHPHGNPHYWTDPENGRVIARAIAARLAELDPAGKADYERGLAAFEAKLDAKEKEWDAKMAPYYGAEVITFHNSWPNFVKRFKLDVKGHIEPKPGIPPSPRPHARIIDLIQKDQIKLILVEPYFDTKTPKYIAGKTGATVLTLYRRSAARPRSPTTSPSSTPTSTRWWRRSEASRDVSSSCCSPPSSPASSSPASMPISACTWWSAASSSSTSRWRRSRRWAATAAYLAGYDLHSGMAYLFSLGFTFIGAVVFAFSRAHRRTRIPQEAVIGIVYAVSAAAAILVMSKATQETEHLKEMLVGNILSVTWPELGRTALLYSLVGAFHYVFRERFLLISMNEEEAERRGWNVRLWDFLFYASFGFVVTSSVAWPGCCWSSVS